MLRKMRKFVAQTKTLFYGTTEINIRPFFFPKKISKEATSGLQ